MNELFEPKNGYLVVVPDTIKISNQSDSSFAINSTNTDERAGVGRVVITSGELVTKDSKVVYHAYSAIKQIIGADTYYFIKESDIITVVNDQNNA